MKKKTLIVLAAALVLLAIPSASARPPVYADVNHGPYGELCTGLYAWNDQIFVICAGKGIITPDHDDCQAYTHVGNLKNCYANLVPNLDG